VSRSISLTATASLMAERTGETWVFLITVEHEQLTAPLRFSSDPGERVSEEPLTYGVTSRDNFYTFLPITATLPDDSDGTPPAIKLVLDNVMRQAIPLLRTITTPPSVTIEMVLASAPDTVETSFPAFDLVDTNYDQASVSVDLTIDGLTTEPYPADTFAPSGFPGLF